MSLQNVLYIVIANYYFFLKALRNVLYIVIANYNIKCHYGMLNISEGIRLLYCYPKTNYKLLIQYRFQNNLHCLLKETKENKLHSKLHTGTYEQYWDWG